MKPWQSQQELGEQLRWDEFLSTLGGGDIGDAEERRASQWPDARRCAPWFLLRELLLGAAPRPAWRLVRAISLDIPHIDDAMVSSWLQAGHLDAITCITFASPALSWRTLVRVCKTLPRLRQVAVNQMEVSSAGLDAFSTSSGVIHWTLGPCDAEWLRRFLDSAITASTRVLSLRALPASDVPWWQGRHVGSVEELHLVACEVSESGVAGLASRIPRGLRALTVTMLPGPQPLAPLLKLHLPELERLDLSRNGLTDSHLTGEHVRLIDGIRDLELAYNQIGRRTLTALAGRLSHVVELDVGNTRVDDQGLAILARHVTRLETLDLAGTRCSPEGIVGFLDGERSARLRVLTLADTGLDTRAVKALGTTVRLPDLEILDLSHCSLDGAAFVHLMAAAELPRLHTLALTGCPLEECRFDEPPRRAELRHLWVDHTRLSITPAAVVFAPERLPALECLRAKLNHFSPETATALASFAERVGLRDLDVEQSLYWGPAELERVLSSVAPRAQRLGVAANPSSAAAIATTLAKTPLPALRELDITGLELNADELESLLGNASLAGLETLRFMYESPADFYALARSPLIGSVRLLVGYGSTALRDEGEALLRAAPGYRGFVTIVLMGLD